MKKMKKILKNDKKKEILNLINRQKRKYKNLNKI